MCSSPGRRAISKRFHQHEAQQSYSEYASMVARSNASYEKRQLEKRQRMLAAEHPHVRVVHINQVVCPLHILKLKKQLNHIACSEILRVIPGNIAVRNDLVSACHTLGHLVVVVEQGHHQELYITKIN